MFFDYRGRQVYYEFIGEGRPVVLVHGLGGSTRYWQCAMKALADAGFHAIAMDLPGFGRSDLPDKRMNVGDYVEVVAALCKALGVDQTCIVGCSMGGLIAWLTAARYPKLVDRLVLVSPVGTPSALDKPIRKMRKRDATIPSPAYLRLPGLGVLIKAAAFLAIDRLLAYPVIIRTFAHSSNVTEEIFDLMRKSAREMRVMHKGLLIWHGPGNPEQWMGKVKAPTLVMWGARDRILPRHSADYYRQGIPHAQTIIYHQCGHVPMLEAPELFNRDLLLFLSGENDPTA